MIKKRTVAPALHPISYDQVKPFARITEDSEAVIMAGYAIPAAVAWAEKFCNRAFITQTWKVTASTFSEMLSDDSDFGQVLRLPIASLLTLSSITYLDADSVSQSFSTSYVHVVTSVDPGFLKLKSDYSWPSTDASPEAVSITFTAGYGPAVTDVPEYLRTVLMLLAVHIFENRTAKDIPDAIAQMLAEFRVNL